jgi:hypothetical protein
MTSVVAAERSGDSHFIPISGGLLLFGEATWSTHVPTVSRAALPTPLPIRPMKRRSAPERFALYLAIFAVLSFVISIAACAALIIIITQLVSSAH